MEGLPVVEVVQIHGVFDGAGVLDVALAEDGLAGGVIMDVSGDGGVELADGFGVEAAALFGEDSYGVEYPVKFGVAADANRMSQYGNDAPCPNS